MGVPKFYRWISERYPCLSEVIKEYQMPEFDNLYLDMNGIIHVCSHPNDDDPHFRISEDKIFNDIFHYIEVLFRMIKPKKVFFMAVDGVAPRAKMNQQRGRRFRSAREAKSLEEEALRKGETLPTEARFDSNCITPGTEFMVRLQEHLKFFVQSKISRDTLWQGPRIFLSGHETPGEGEHKIMDFIRYEKSCNPNYDPNTKHCLYGLDADLIMLGLCSHEPHFSLLREEVRFGGKKSQKRNTSVEQTTFHLLHLSLLREYLQLEFQSVKDKLSFEYDVEQIIDDWVLMGFLVGNDFIPHLPNFHIAHDALPTIYNTYIEVLPHLDGYINEGGTLNLSRFEEFMKSLAKFDYEKFDESYADLKWLEGKKSSRGVDCTDFRMAKPQKSQNSFDCLNQLSFDMDKSALGLEDLLLEDTPSDQLLIDLSINSLKNEPALPSALESDDDGDTFELEFQSMKRNYYMNKLEFEEITPQVLEGQAFGYARAIQWNLHYYYNGVVSWSWYYPHHYAPYISDIKNFSHMKLDYDFGTPFLPYQQLLAVLPPLSKQHLPKAYQTLMTSPDSPLLEFYPENFKTDLNGKQQDWEAVVLIPFLDENKLISAMSVCESNLTKSERLRNRHGPCLLYTYSPEDQGAVKSLLPNYSPNISFNHAFLTEIKKDFYCLQPCAIKKGLCENVLLDVHFPGFPSLQYISFTARPRKANVTVFQMSSRKESIVLKVDEQDHRDAEDIADGILGKTVFVSWPHLVEACVTAISTSTHKYSLPHDSASEDDELHIEELSAADQRAFRASANRVEATHLTRHGIDISDTRILIYAQPITGRKYMFSTAGRVTLETKYADIPQVYPFQTLVQDIAVHSSELKPYYTIEEVFPVKSTVFMLVHPHYGCQGEVVNIEKGSKSKIRVKVILPDEPDFNNILRQQKRFSDHYVPGFIVAQKTRLSRHLISRMTGSLFLVLNSQENLADTNFGSKINIGLNLKFNKKNEEVPGYTKRSEGTWLYSDKAIDVIKKYLTTFPDMWENINEKVNADVFFLDDLFPGENGLDKVAEVQKFLNQLPTAKIERQSCSSEMLDNGIVKAIEASIDKMEEKATKVVKYALVLVRPKLVYKPSCDDLIIAPDNKVEFKLFDRVVNIRSGYSVPLGARGTIIGIHKGEVAEDTTYIVLFDEKFIGGISVQGSSAKAYNMSSTGLINLSHGCRKKEAYEAARSDGVQIQSDGLSSVTGSRSSKTYAEVTTHANNRKSAEFSSPKVDNYLRINHSPTSPFQPQTANLISPKTLPWKPPQNTLLNAQDISLTPTGYKTRQTSPPKHHSPLQSSHDKEFLDIWRSLKQANLSTPEAKLGDKHNISLEHAAKSLPKLTGTTSSPEKAITDTNSSHSTNSVTNDVLVKFVTSANQAVADSASYNHESSAVLKHLLHIGDSNEKEVKSALKPEDEDKETFTKGSEPTNNVLKLLSHLQSNYSKLPLYTYYNIGNVVTAEVTLPDYFKCSAQGENRQKASELAAAEALKYLESKKVHPQRSPNIMTYGGVRFHPPQTTPATIPTMSFSQSQQTMQPPMSNMNFSQPQFRSFRIGPQPVVTRTAFMPQSSLTRPDLNFTQNMLRARITAPIRHSPPNHPVDMYRMTYEQQMRNAHAYHPSRNPNGTSSSSPVKSKTGSPLRYNLKEEGDSQKKNLEQNPVTQESFKETLLSATAIPFVPLQDSKKNASRKLTLASSLSSRAIPFLPVQVTKQNTPKKSTPHQDKKASNATVENLPTVEESKDLVLVPTSHEKSVIPVKRKPRTRLACNFSNPLSTS